MNVKFVIDYDLIELVDAIGLDYDIINEKDGKAYTRVANKIVKNNAAGKADLESWVTYMKSKGYLKEHKGDWKKSPETQTSNQSSTMETSF